MTLCLSEFIGKGTRKNPYRTKVPGATIDLRPDCSKREGYALVNTNESVKKWKLGDGFQDTFGYRIRNAIQSRMGVDISAVKRFDVLAAKLLMEPNGWNPLQANQFAGRYEIWLGGLVWEFPLIRGGAYDDFNRPDGAIGDPWVKYDSNTGLAGVVSNACKNVGAGDDTWYAYTGAATISDQYSQFKTIATVTGDIGPMVRLQGTPGSNATVSAYLLAMAISDFAKIVGGAFSTFGSYSNATLNPGDILGIRVEGSTLTAYEPGSGDIAAVTDSSVPSGGQPGIFFFDNTTSLDDWQGGDLGTTAVSFPVATGNDDGTGYRTAATWAGIDSGAFTGDETLNLFVSKTFVTPNYFEDISVVRFDTSSIPDDAVITSARLKWWVDNKNDNSQGFVLEADYYDFGGTPTVSGDWIQTVAANILDSLPLASVLSGWNVQELSDISGINKSGYTGIRLALNAAATPTGNNTLEISGFAAGLGHPLVQLDVDYTVSAYTPAGDAGPTLIRVIGNRQVF